MGNEAVVSPAKSTVDAFGEWLTSPENPRFTQVIANRLWKKAFGIGLIEPVDDIKEYTQASNPELMKFLEDLMIGLDYDLQAFQEVIYQTSAYQREAVLEEPVPGEPFYFAGPILRRMSAEQIWDSIVTLTVEDPDKPSAGRELLAERKIKAVELIASSIYEQSPGEFLQNGLEVAGIQKDLAVEIEAAQAKVQEAREAADPDLIKQASAEAREIRRRLYQLVEEKVYQKELTEKLAGIEKASLSGSESDEESSELVEGLASAMESEGEGSMMSMMSGSGNYGVIDRLVDTLLAEQKEALAEERAKVKNRRIKQWKIESKDDLRNYRNFAKIEGRMQRASDINSPAPPGHFLREFGQSDRELVENSSDQASVTQALAMLNGPVLGAVTSKYSTLARSMKGEAFKDRLDIIYLSMLSRLPTPEERAIFREAWTSDPGTGTVSGMVWTVLNTRQFLFIQ
jgi:hypothetical protein